MRIPFHELKQTLTQILQTEGFTPERAETCAKLFAQTSLDGVYSHGLNRLPRFMQYIRKGYINIHAEPTLVHKFGSLESWDGNAGPGNLNALASVNQAIKLASENGIGAVALRNTNHWMRGGTYGWEAANAGYIGICFTNTLPNMPPWGGVKPTLGNNPLVIAVPGVNGKHIVLDMAMSQYSFGKLENYAKEAKVLPVPGGFTNAGILSENAKEVLDSGRVLPVGFWKGSGLSMMLDVVAGLLSSGRTTSDIAGLPDEIGISQVFICLALNKITNTDFAENLVNQVIAYTKTSAPIAAGSQINYPGENTWRLREENTRLGIPIDAEIWAQIKSGQF